ncbi:MAG: sulfatase [Bacteroidota bacterium]
MHLLLCLILSCQKEHKQQVEKQKPPLNILWITNEDMSPHLGCYGDTIARTPNLDEFAKESIRFTHAFSVSGVCAPSRSCLITGMYPTSIGAQHMRTQKRTSALDQITDPKLLAIPVYEATPPVGVKCFTEYLRKEGYYCTNNSKTDYQFANPVTAWDESSRNAHWKNRKEGQPFFSVFNIGITHESQVWARKDDPLITDPAKVRVPPYYPDTETIRRDIARNYDNIALMDDKVGEILAELEADGLMENTVIFYYSDHGDGLPRAKRWVYDSGLQVPLLVRFPNAENGGTVNDQLVSFVDFAPTILSLLRIDIPAYMQGKAFLGEKADIPRKYIYAARDRMDPATDTRRAVRDHQFKYIKNYQPNKPYIQFLPYRDKMDLMQELLRYKKEGLLNENQWQIASGAKPLEELYDTHNDPYEINNLADDPEYKNQLETLRKAHENWKEKYGDLGHMPEVELIKKLWPPNGVQPFTASPKIKANLLEGKQQVQIELTCATDGASIAYKFPDSPNWLLYHQPLTLINSDSIQTKAIRIGYKESETTVQWINVD